MTNHQLKIQSARTALVLDQPFFGVLALRLKVIPDPSCSSMWTDGVHIGYSPKWVDGLTHQELLGVIAHEVMHNACGHPWRRGGRDHEKFNVAADKAINSLLKSAGFTLPQPGTFPTPAEEGKSAEWIYDRLPADPKDGGGKGKGPPAPGEVRDAPGDAADHQATEAEWQAATVQAARAAEAAGKLPGHMKRFAGDVAKPKADWRSVLRRFVQETAKADYTWTRPSTRYLASGLFLPSLHSHAMGPILVAIDTSGSIDDVTLGQFWAEVCAIQDEARPARVHIVYADAAVQRHDIFERDEVLEMHPCGGGGTDFRPAFKLAGDLDEPPVCICYLTDLAGSFPASSEIPTLWATVRAGEVPFGEVIEIA